VPLNLLVAIEDLILVIWRRDVEQDVANQYKQPIRSTFESAGEWIVALELYDAVSNPLPELFLRGPKFSAVRANHQRILFTPCHLTAPSFYCCAAGIVLSR
jgi:hypothetical protein